MGDLRAWSGDPADLLTLLDRAYDLDAAEPEWLHAVASAATPFLASGHGMSAFLADADGRIHTPCSIGEVEWGGWAKVWFEGIRQFPPPMMRRALELTPVAYSIDRRGALLNGHATMAEAIAADLRGEPGAGGVARRGIWDEAGQRESSGPFPDSLDIVGLDPSGEAVVLLGVRRTLSKRPVGAREAAWLGRIAGHLASALRLRRALVKRETLLDGSAPVFDTEARPLHAADDSTRLGLTALREAVRAQLRTRHRSMSPTEVLEHWRALVLGQYSLLDVFDTDGKRFVVARPNVPAARAIERAASLTAQERAVLALLAGGASNKLIAYDLGISTSTVAARLASAASKLGTTTHAELVRRARDVAPTD